jgi:hypothetical protein
MLTSQWLKVLATAAILALGGGAAMAQSAADGITVEGPVTAVNDGMINGFTHCPIRTATINDLEIVWACGGPLPAIGSNWRVTYFESYPSGETLVSRQRIPVSN